MMERSPSGIEHFLSEGEYSIILMEKAPSEGEKGASEVLKCRTGFKAAWLDDLTPKITIFIIKQMTSEEYTCFVHEEVKRIMERYNVKFKIEEPKH